jgi:hypothetical protein
LDFNRGHRGAQGNWVKEYVTNGPLIDQLSERGTADAVKRVAEAVESGVFRSVVVTSRKAREEGRIWETFETMVARALTAPEVPDYVNEYVLEGRREHVVEQIAPLIAGRTAFSPLFLRFAIEQALKGEVTATSTRDLVLQYIEALRKGRLDLDADDMLRGAANAATESVRYTLAPREIEPSYLSVRPGTLRVVRIA